MSRLLAALGLTCLLAVAAPAGDTLWISTNRYELPAGQSIPSQLGLVAEVAQLGGTVEDDVFVVARAQAEFTGENRGDTWVLAGQTVLNGLLRDHVRAAGQSLIVRGQLERGFYAVGSSVLLSTGSVVQGDVVVAGENVTLEGQVGGQVNLMAQSVTLAGTVSGSVRILAQDIVVMPGTRIGGDLVYTSPKELILTQRDQVAGELKRLQPAGPDVSAFSTESLVLLAVQGVGALLVGLPFTGLFPRAVGRATRLVRFNPLRCLLAGFAALFIIPVVAVAAALTLVGLPLGLLAAGLAAALLYLGKLAVALVLGGMLLKRSGPQSIASAMAAMAIGLLVLYSAFALPVIGSSVALLAAVLGSGSLWWALLRGEVRGEGAPPPVPPAPGAGQV